MVSKDGQRRSLLPRAVPTLMLKLDENGKEPSHDFVSDDITDDTAYETEESMETSSIAVLAETEEQSTESLFISPIINTEGNIYHNYDIKNYFFL